MDIAQHLPSFAYASRPADGQMTATRLTYRLIRPGLYLDCPFRPFSVSRCRLDRFDRNTTKFFSADRRNCLLVVGTPHYSD
jgi:hypothetical protein